MLIKGDPEVFEIAFRTIRVSVTAVIISTILGIPCGVFLGLKRFRGRKFILTIINILMGLPPVVAGLWVTIFLWRSGRLGNLSLLFTPTAIVIAQVLGLVPDYYRS